MKTFINKKLNRYSRVFSNKKIGLWAGVDRLFVDIKNHKKIIRRGSLLLYEKLKISTMFKYNNDSQDPT